MSVAVSPLSPGTPAGPSCPASPGGPVAPVLPYIKIINCQHFEFHFTIILGTIENVNVTCIFFYFY